MPERQRFTSLVDNIENIGTNMRQTFMRQTLMASAVAAAAFIAASFFTPAPAQAQDYPWCRLGNHDCMYSTYAQCMAALSGTFGDCKRNPTYGYFGDATVAD